MATTPAFANIPVVGSATLSASADTGLGPTNTNLTHSVVLLGGQGPRQVVDGVLTNSSTLLTSATAAFNSGDIQRPVSGTGIPANTVIQYVVSATNVIMSQPVGSSAGATGVTVTLAGGAGTKVEEVVWVPNGSPTVLGVLNLFLVDPGLTTLGSGTAVYRIRDSAQVNATPTNSATVAPVANEFPDSPYTNLWIPPTWTLNVTSTVASQLATVLAFGANA